VPSLLDPGPEQGELRRRRVEHFAAVVDQQLQFADQVREVGHPSREPLQRRGRGREPDPAALRGAQQPLQVGQVLGLQHVFPIEECTEPGPHVDRPRQRQLGAFGESRSEFPGRGQALHRLGVVRGRRQRFDRGTADRGDQSCGQHPPNDGELERIEVERSRCRCRGHRAEHVAGPASVVNSTPR
jgi:hypothetical protein